MNITLKLSPMRNSTLAVKFEDSHEGGVTYYIWDKRGKVFDSELIFIIQTTEAGEVLYVNTCFFGAVAVIENDIRHSDLVNYELLDELLTSD